VSKENEKNRVASNKLIGVKENSGFGVAEENSSGEK